MTQQAHPSDPTYCIVGVWYCQTKYINHLLSAMDCMETQAVLITEVGLCNISHQKSSHTDGMLY